MKKDKKTTCSWGVTPTNQKTDINPPRAKVLAPWTEYVLLRAGEEGLLKEVIQ